VITLRDYQTEAVESCEQSLATHDRVMLVLPTGCGKTEVFAALARDWQQGRVLVIAPQINLVDQARDKLAQRCDLYVGVEQASRSSYKHDRVIAASKQTLIRAERFKTLKGVGLVVVDECHLAATKIFAKTLDWFIQQGAKVLGVTATPNRHDKVSMRNLFDTCAYELSILDAIESGWLVAPQARCVKVKGLDLGQVKSNRDDFQQGDLARVMEDEKVIHEIADITARESADMKTVVYCVSVREAKAVAELLVDQYGKRAGWVCGDQARQSHDDRATTLRNFTKGDLQFVCNVGVLTTGWDFPGLEHIVMARPTRSQSLYTQIMGRGTRPLPGTVDFPDSTAESRRAAIAASAKPHFTVTDLRDNSLEHKLITAVDVLGGQMGLNDAARKIARDEMRKTGGPLSVLESIRAAEEEERKRAEHQRRKEQEAQERVDRLKREAHAHYSKQQVDLFSAGQRAPGQKATRVFRFKYGRYAGKTFADLTDGQLKQIAGFWRNEWMRGAAKTELTRRTQSSGALGLFQSLAKRKETA
jgi:superfamily II DNA or RNA helicase